MNKPLSLQGFVVRNELKETTKKKALSKNESAFSGINCNITLFNYYFF